MVKKIQYLWSEVTTSFWFLPIVILLFAIGLAVGAIYLDNQVRYIPTGVFTYFLAGSTKSAQLILSTIAGAMIGVAGTVFSITLVTLTLASSQFGPRLLRNFMYDKINQIVLGTYVSTFVYCLLVLNSVTEIDNFQFIPVFAVTGAIIAALINIVLLIVFIHHTSISIQADKIIADISKATLKNLRDRFPNQSEESRHDESIDLNKLIATYAYKQEVKSEETGYLQSIDFQRLQEIAEENDALIVVNGKAGSYQVVGIDLCVLHSNKEQSEELNKSITKCFIIGQIRTSLQDAEFEIHQIVEIATRALSPGTNDPRTSIVCIDSLLSILSYLIKVPFPSPLFYNEDNVLRIVSPSFTFSSMLDAAYNQIRQYGEGSPAVIIHLMESLNTLKSFTTEKDKIEAIERHTKMLLKAGKRSFVEDEDLKDLKKRYKAG